MRKNFFIIFCLAVIIIFSASLFSCSLMTSTSSTTPGIGTLTTTNTATLTATTPATTTATAPQTAVITASAVPGQITLPSIADVVAKVKPSVVAINVEVTTYDFFNQPVQQQGAGSGWIIRSDGYIVTNNHVVDAATNIVVTLNDGGKYPAINVYTDTYTDLAVIKIDAQGLPALGTGNSDTLNVGDWVVAIGNALGQGISATKGIVSALNISLTETAGQPLNNLVQTDAAINPGNSGGPLVDLNGNVIGITSIKISQVGVEGMGYAISINQALPVINTLISNGRVVRPWLGISAFTVDSMVVSYYNLSVESGVLITDVIGGSPADQAGLRPGDVITAVDGNAQTDVGALMTYINSLQIGQTISITYQRGNNSSTVDVTLAQNPS